MKHLIDKSALVAEIEKRKEEEVNYDENGGFASWADHNHYSTLESIEDFLDTLEVKEVDLEKEINAYRDNEMRFLSDEVGYDTLSAIAKHFFELGLKARKEEVK